MLFIAIKTLWHPLGQWEKLLAVPTSSIFCCILLVFWLILHWKSKDFLYKIQAFSDQNWIWRILGENRETGRRLSTLVARKWHRKWMFHGNWWRVYRPDFLFFYKKNIFFDRVWQGCDPGFRKYRLFALKIKGFPTAIENQCILRPKLKMTDF